MQHPDIKKKYAVGSLGPYENASRFDDCVPDALENTFFATIRYSSSDSFGRYKILVECGGVFKLIPFSLGVFEKENQLISALIFQSEDGWRGLELINNGKPIFQTVSEALVVAISLMEQFGSSVRDLSQDVNSLLNSVGSVRVLDARTNQWYIAKR